MGRPLGGGRPGAKGARLQGCGGPGWARARDRSLAPGPGRPARLVRLPGERRLGPAGGRDPGAGGSGGPACPAALGLQRPPAAPSLGPAPHPGASASRPPRTARHPGRSRAPSRCLRSTFCTRVRRAAWPPRRLSVPPLFPSRPPLFLGCQHPADKSALAERPRLSRLPGPPYPSARSLTAQPSPCWSV